jgi:hypothetical protein
MLNLEELLKAPEKFATFIETRLGLAIFVAGICIYFITPYLQHVNDSLDKIQLSMERLTEAVQYYAIISRGK